MMVSARRFDSHDEVELVGKFGARVREQHANMCIVQARIYAFTHRPTVPTLAIVPRRRRQQPADRAARSPLQQRRAVVAAARLRG